VVLPASMWAMIPIFRILSMRPFFGNAMEQTLSSQRPMAKMKPKAVGFQRTAASQNHWIY